MELIGLSLFYRNEEINVVYFHVPMTGINIRSCVEQVAVRIGKDR